MGALLFATGLLVFALRAWVIRNGGPPDGGSRVDHSGWKPYTLKLLNAWPGAS